MRLAWRYFKVNKWDLWIFARKERFFKISKRLKTKKAVERNIEIIGEAVNRLTNYKNAEIEIQNAKKKLQSLANEVLRLRSA